MVLVDEEPECNAVVPTLVIGVNGVNDVLSDVADECRIESNVTLAAPAALPALTYIRDVRRRELSTCCS